MRGVYVNAYSGRGQKAYDEGDYRSALEDFEAALEYPTNIGVGKPVHPRDAQILYLVGAAYEAMGDVDQARPYWEQAASERHDRWSELRYYEALSLQKLGSSDEAAELFDGLIRYAEETLAKEEKETAEAHYLMGLGYLGKGAQDKAKEAFAEALNAQPDYRKARRVLEDLEKTN